MKERRNNNIAKEFTNWTIGNRLLVVETGFFQD